MYLALAIHVVNLVLVDLARFVPCILADLARLVPCILATKVCALHLGKQGVCLASWKGVCMKGLCQGS